MGLLSSLGSIAGSFFGPLGTTIGGALGGAFDSSQSRDYQEGQQGAANEYNSAEAAKNREFQASQAELNRGFQERMSGSAYQRSMADLKLAGLNPMLAYSQGGATTPTGSMASGSQASYPTGAGAAMLQAESSSRSADAAMVGASASASQAATAAKLGDETVFKIKSEVRNLESTNDQVKAVTQNLGVQYQNLVKEGYNLTEIGNQLRATVDKLRAEVPKINSETFVNAARELLISAQAQHEGSKNRLTDVDVRAAEAFGELGKTVGTLEPFLRLLWNIFRR